MAHHADIVGVRPSARETGAGRRARPVYAAHATRAAHTAHTVEIDIFERNRR